jgi:type IV pilus assembly protein PilB
MERVASEAYPVTCWNCLSEFDALAAIWCSCDPKTPTKLCPFCFKCFCESSETYKKDFWRSAPPRLLEESQTLSRSRDRLGDILIRTGRITTPQLLEMLVEQKRTGKRLGELLVEHKLVTPETITSALQSQGVNPLTDTRGAAYASKPVWEQSAPEAIIEYVLSLGARKGASDIHIEPAQDGIGVKYRIDGFFFRVDSIPKRFQPALTQKLFDYFKLDASRPRRPQTSRCRGRLDDGDYDLVVQTLPTAYGVSATVKLIDRSTFLKDFSNLGLELEDRVRLIEQLRQPSGLILLTAPVFNGAHATSYSIMNFLVQGQRQVVSLETPVYWDVEGARQVSVETDGATPAMAETLRSVIAVRPEVVMLSAIPDSATAQLATQLASSVVVIAVLPATTAAKGIGAFLSLGVPAPLVSAALTAVTCQRLVRQICRVCHERASAPSPQTLALRGIDAQEAQTLTFSRGRGCASCNKVGYRGRRAIFEVFTTAPEVRSAVINSLPAPELEAIGVGAGMRTLREQCLQLVREGITTFDEFVRLRL